MSAVQASPSSHDLGHADDGSHVSESSFTPLPHTGEQSLSLFALAPGGQHSSPAIAAVTGICVHLTLQSSALPDETSTVHGSPSSQEVGQG